MSSNVLLNDPLLQAYSLKVALDGKLILKDINFSIPQGTMVGLLGPNGSGKTTLLRTIGGLLPYRGTLKLFNTDVRYWKPRAMAQKAATVRQGSHFLFDFTVKEAILLGRAPYKRLLEQYYEEDRELLYQVLSQVDLIGYEKRSVLTLSGGERQRVWLAQALIRDPELLLLDEPTSFLDIHHQHAFLRLVRNLVQCGKTVIAAIHDIDLAARYCSDLVVLNQGHLAAMGKPEDVLTRELFATVFKMNARISAADGNLSRLLVESPISNTETSS